LFGVCFSRSYENFVAQTKSKLLKKNAAHLQPLEKVGKICSQFAAKDFSQKWLQIPTQIIE